MDEMKLGLVKRLVYAFTCLFGSKEDIMEILPSKIEKEIPKKESIKEEEPTQQNKPTAYTFGVMDRFCLIKVDGKLLEGFIAILSKGNHPVVKQDLIILNLKNMIDKEIFFENTMQYGKVCSIGKNDVTVTMGINEESEEDTILHTLKFEPEVIQVQEKDIGVHRLRKGSKFIDFVGVNMNAIKDSYLRWTKEWPLISSMIKKN